MFSVQPESTYLTCRAFNHEQWLTQSRTVPGEKAVGQLEDQFEALGHQGSWRLKEVRQLEMEVVVLCTFPKLLIAELSICPPKPNVGTTGELQALQLCISKGINSLLICMGSRVRLCCCAGSCSCHWNVNGYSSVVALHMSVGGAGRTLLTLQTFAL